MFAPLEWDWGIAKSVFPLTLAWLAMMASSNICLRYVEVTFYQVVRALTIIFSLFLQMYEFPEFVVGNERIFACFLIVAGFVTSSIGEIRFVWTGLIAGVVSSLFVAYYGNSAKKGLLLVSGSSWRLIIYTTTLAIPVFIPFMLIFENVPEAWEAVSNIGKPGIATGIFISGIFGYLINLAIFLQIHYTSPLTNTISGTLKGTLQVLIGWLVFRNEISSVGFLGILFVVGGSTYYAYVGYKMMQTPKPEEEEAGCERERK